MYLTRWLLGKATAVLNHDFPIHRCERHCGIATQILVSDAAVVTRHQPMTKILYDLLRAMWCRGSAYLHRSIDGEYGVYLCYCIHIWKLWNLPCGNVSSHHISYAISILPLKGFSAQTERRFTNLPGGNVSSHHISYLPI